MTRPSLAWSSALKYTTDKLDFITDPDMYLMIENNMRSVIATISHRYAQANNPLVQGYDPSKLNSWITYLDANNAYETAMSKPLPVENFTPAKTKTSKQATTRATFSQHQHNGTMVKLALCIVLNLCSCSYA